MANPGRGELLLVDVKPDATAVVQENWIISDIEDATDTTYGVAIIGLATSKQGGFTCRPTFCVFEDGIVRGDQCSCDRTSPPIE